MISVYMRWCLGYLLLLLSLVKWHPGGTIYLDSQDTLQNQNEKDRIYEEGFEQGV